MKIDEFMNHCADILTALRDNQEKIEAYNFNQEAIDGFAADVETLKKYESEREKAEITLNNDTYMRSEARRETYDLMHYIASLGRVYYRKKNPAKSEDYIITRKKRKKAKTQETTSDTVEITNSDNTNVEMDVTNTVTDTETTEDQNNTTSGDTDNTNS